MSKRARLTEPVLFFGDPAMIVRQLDLGCSRGDDRGMWRTIACSVVLMTAAVCMLPDMHEFVDPATCVTDSKGGGCRGLDRHPEQPLTRDSGVDHVGWVPFAILLVSAGAMIPIAIKRRLSRWPGIVALAGGSG